LAREMGVPRVVIPCRPGITNALGCVVADLRHDFVNTVNRSLESVDMDQIHGIFVAQNKEGERLIAKEPVEVMDVKHLYSVDMQFVGQTHLLRVNLPDANPSRESLRHLFEEAYFNRFRVQLANIHANLVNVNTSVIGQRAEMNLSTLIDPEGRKDTVADAETGRRTVVFNDGPHETPVYWRDYLPINMEIDGPAIIEQMDCTTLVEPGDKARGDADGNIIIGVGGL